MSDARRRVPRVPVIVFASARVRMSQLALTASVLLAVVPLYASAQDTPQASGRPTGVTMPPAAPAPPPRPQAPATPPPAAAAAVPASVATPVPPRIPPDETLRMWIAEMKSQPRGPFSKVQWYCKDGSVLDPTPFACAQRGGGLQYGEWSDRTKVVRAAGFPIANVLAPLTPENVLNSSDPEFLRVLLLEKFLVAFDDGWILRRAQYHRGVLQDENEKASADKLLQAMLAHNVWRQRFIVLREAARLLPHRAETPVLTELRGLATVISEKDPNFATLRNKIHIAPSGDDARRVREYIASGDAKSELNADYIRLAELIDLAYTRSPLAPELAALAKRVHEPELREKLGELVAGLQSSTDPESQFRLASEALVLIRNELAEFGGPQTRLIALDTSLTAELSAFTASRGLLEALPGATRAQRIAWMHSAVRAAYGLGLLTNRELSELALATVNLSAQDLSLEAYRNELRQFERAPGWSARRLAYYFGGTIERLARIEPLAEWYIPDRLRSSPMLFYSSVLDSLLEDANELGGVQHRLFGNTVSGGLRRLNPGIGTGVLRSPQAPVEPPGSESIFLVPETIADLPPAAGILTAEEGNPLSHVQLLARNLGIPNVVVDRRHLPDLESRRGKTITVAASTGGVVRIDDNEASSWFSFLGGSKPANEDTRTVIHVNVQKLDLGRRDFIPTAQLGADDSGRIVGPKAAQVAELAKRFPGKVSPGLAIPFGAFRAVLDRPRAPGEASMFQWMEMQYAELAELRKNDPAAHAARIPVFLKSVRTWILTQQLGPEFMAQLRDAMRQSFGPDGSYGVFVRSDTNVEDLPGFTGAGLNKTVHNVVGLGNVAKAIKEVWASPFTERAFSWRQDLMDLPQHVYASVLLHQSVPSERSGVMITADIDSNDPAFLTIATNTGVGGGVDGQLAETLRVNATNGDVRLLGSATAREKRVLLKSGGSVTALTLAPDTLLPPGEIAQLLALARALPAQYPQMVDESGDPAPADIEFGFVGGKLMLFQIRPFLQNKAAQRNRLLAELDASLRRRKDVRVDINAVPARGS